MPHFSRVLNAELYKYRKRKKISLDGSLPGVPYTNFRRSRRYVSGMPYSPGPASYHHHNTYMGSLPQAYNPSLNAPAIQQTEYEPYEPFDLPHITMPSFQPRHMPRNTGQEIPPPGRMSVLDDDMDLIGRLRMAQGESPPPRENIEAPFLNGAALSLSDPATDDSVDTFPSFSEVADALEQLSRVLPPDHQDLVNLRMVAQGCLDLMNAWSQGVSDPYAANYHETADPAAAPIADLDYDGAMTQEMFSQAMEQVTEEQIVPGTEAQPVDPCAAMYAEYYQELQPNLEEIVQQATPEQDDWQKQQQMYEEEMMIMNPYMMPGPFGPMGQMGSMPMPPGLG